MNISESTIHTEILEVFDSLPDLYLVISPDPDLTILAASDAYLNAAFSGRENIIDKHFFEVFPSNPNLPNDEGITVIINSLNKVLRTKKPQKINVLRFDVPRNKGEYEEKYWTVINTPVLDKNGNIHYIIHKVCDVTQEILYRREIKKLSDKTIVMMNREHEALREAEFERNRLRTLFLQAPVAIAILTGHNFKIELANEVICIIWGKKQKDIIGKSLLEALPELQGQGFDVLLEEVLSSGKAYIGKELPAVFNRDGRHEAIYFNFIYQPIFDLFGNIPSIIVVANDVTEEVQSKKCIVERKKQYKYIANELIVKNKELRKINNDLDNFIYTASHDLKAPVSNIEGLVNSLKDSLSFQSRKDPEVKMILEMINKSINRFKSTINYLTDISKIQKNITEDIEEVNLCDVVSDVKSGIEDWIKETEATILIDNSRCYCIKFTREHLRSIVYNLLSNAIKYRSPDRKPLIRIKTDKLENYVLLEVQDNGLGIKQEQINKIFTLFKRMHTHVEGNGIGLYIVKRILDNAEGKIEVESEINKGSSFKLYFKT